MSITQTIGHVIYETRIGARLTQRQLAKKMDLPRTYVSKIENGKAVPTLRSLETFASGLGVAASQLVRLAEAMPVRQQSQVPLVRKRYTKDVGLPQAPLISHSAAVEKRKEIGRALGTLPKETR